MQVASLYAWNAVCKKNYRVILCQNKLISCLNKISYFVSKEDVLFPVDMSLLILC